MQKNCIDCISIPGFRRLRRGGLDIYADGEGESRQREVRRQSFRSGGSGEGESDQEDKPKRHKNPSPISVAGSVRYCPSFSITEKRGRKRKEIGKISEIVMQRRGKVIGDSTRVTRSW